MVLNLGFGIEVAQGAGCYDLEMGDELFAGLELQGNRLRVNFVVVDLWL
jgi:hypothetical protein